MNGLNLSIASAASLEIDGSEYYYFQAELKLPGVSLVGVVPASVVASEKDSISFLILWVFGLLIFMFTIAMVYVVVSEKKARRNKELIRERDREKLFKNFVRLDEKRNRNIEGTGLGLNLTDTALNGAIALQPLAPLQKS
jgi:ABC-type multidrug transport system fused ATPase/permease subunit